MADPSMTIPKWVKIVIQAVGSANIILVLCGILFLARSTHLVLTSRVTDHPNIPYFGFAFAGMAFINVTFLVILLVTAVRFLQIRTSFINPYSLAVLALAVYGCAIGILWRTGQGIGMSIAAATGVGNMGIGPFELCFVVPYLYPVVTIILLQVLKRRYTV
jgi:hypothetical protein